MSHPLPPAVDVREEQGRRVFHVGPYRLAERLGQGAMGVVYRAEHTDSGEVVALKTAKYTRETAVASIRREVDILSRVDHAGVVHLHDAGVSKGVPWFAMELLHGHTLYHTLIEAADPFDSQIELGAPRTATDSGQARWHFDGPSAAIFEPKSVSEPQVSGLQSEPQQARRTFEIEQVRPILVILSRLCRTLSYLHNRGLVHRDLKPSNVFLRDELEPVIVDFGVVGWFEGSAGRERLAGIDRRRFAGTLQYMAPEQIAGELVDARADLYAIGCILYAAVVGRHPFNARTPQEVIRRHLEADFVAPSRLVCGLPREICALIDRLLAADPALRLSHADIVASILERIAGAEDASTELPASERSTHLNKPRFVGRADVLTGVEEALAPLLEDAPASTRRSLEKGHRRPDLLVVGGHSGSGKTRLAMEVGARAEHTGFRVTTESAEARLAEPLGMFRSTLQAIADHCRERGAEVSAQVVGRRMGVLAQFEPSLFGLPGSAEGRLPVELPARAARVRAFAFLTETLVAFASCQPLLIIIDDLHLADEMSLGFVASILRSGGLEGVAIVATYRLEETDSLSELFSQGRTCHFELEALGCEEVSTLVGGMLGMEEPPANLVERLARWSVGNPFAISEYVHAAVERGLLLRGDDGNWQVDEVLLELGEPGELLSPSRRLASVIEGRLERLNEDERRLVDFAAVSNRRLDARLLGQLCGLSNASLDAAVERLCRRRILERHERGEKVRLVEQVRSVAYESLGPSRRRQLHRRLARTLERRVDDTDVLHLLEQWRGAGVCSRELVYLERAAEDALLRGAATSARALVQRGIRLINQLEARGDNTLDLRRATLERMLAYVHWSSGSIELTITMLEHSLAHLGFRLPKTKVQWCKKAALEAGEQLRNLLCAPTPLPAQTLDARRFELALESGIALLWPTILTGNLDKAATLALMLTNMADRLGSGYGRYYALPFVMVAMACERLGLGSLAPIYEATGRQNLGRTESVTDLVGATRLLAYRAASVGAWEEADEYLYSALDGGERFGSDALLVTGAILELIRDHFERAERLLERAETSIPLGENEMRSTWCRVVRAMMARQQGDSRRALELSQGQVERFRKMSDPTGLGYALIISSLSHCETGEVARGAELAEEAFDVLVTLRGSGDRNLILYYLYQGLPSALLECIGSAQLSEDRRACALGRFRQLVEWLERFAANTPVARAAMWRNRGILAAIDGDVSQGSKMLSKSLAEARAYELAFEDRLTRRAACRLAALSATVVGA